MYNLRYSIWARKFIEHACREMKVGQKVEIHRDIFTEAYPYGWPSIYETHEHAFLSNMIGSAWGVWRVRRSFGTRNFIISKHKESDKRYYVDPDREHLFKKMPDGTLELR